MFKLTDLARNEYYIMHEDFYSKNGLKSPVTRNMLDSLEIGHSINGHVEVISGFTVVTKITRVN